MNINGIILNPENATEQEVLTYKKRTSVRALVFDGQNRVALMNLTKQGYHKLPGGGIESGETEEGALRRECIEELGCRIEIIRKLAETVEYIKMLKVVHYSYCYLAKVIGEKGVPNFTQEEIKDGFEILWVSSEKALGILESDITEILVAGLYILPREKYFLKKFIKKTP